MIDLKKELPHWTSLCATVQVIINFALIYIFFKTIDSEAANEQKWLYFAVANGLTIVMVIINIALSKDNFIRHTVNIASMLVYTYILPVTLLMSSIKPAWALIAGMTYIMLIICVTPIHISCLAFTGGVIFTWRFPQFSGVEIDTIYKPLLAYLAMTGVAMLWRSLFIKLMLGYLQLTNKDPGKESLYESKIQELEQERNLLRSEIVAHVVELNEAVLSHQPEKQEGQ
ncbi:MAG: hypothetical protein NE334_06315 [Lentisphaeraceae bacterium]|nr:hypothetical protein [Lentisphaeraceae bacterium]